MIADFYVVTMTSIYHVFMDGEGRFAQVLKITTHHGPSNVSAGSVLEGKLVSIGRQIQMLNPTTNERNIDNIPLDCWGPNSSPIIALFGGLEAAKACGRKSDLSQYDERWIESTRSIIDEIGPDHQTVIPDKTFLKEVL